MSSSSSSPLPYDSTSKHATVAELCDRLDTRRKLLRLVSDSAATAALREEIRTLESHIAAKLEAAERVVNFAAYKRLRRARA